MDEKTTKIIEINGVKMEIDLRQATVVDNYKVGDMVKVLNKEYSNTYKVSPGIVTDFFYNENAEGNKEGAIQLLILEESYDSVDLKFKVYGSKTEDFSISHFNSYEKKLPMEDINSKFNKEVEALEEKIRGLKTKQEAFNELFVGVTH